ncbi:MAG: S8 family serine peptidase [Planctomycetota bacterium]|jgi:subtilisin family serine protease
MNGTTLLAALMAPVLCWAIADGATPVYELVVRVDLDDDGDDVLEEIEDQLDDDSGVTVAQVGDSAYFVLTVPDEFDTGDLDALLDNLDARLVGSEKNCNARCPEGEPEDLPTLGSDLLSCIPTQDGFSGLSLADAHVESTGSGIVVAVVDTGIDPTHPSLEDAIAPGGYDFLDFDNDPTDEENAVDNGQYGHGTFIASLVLAVAPDATILPVRVLDADGHGTPSTVAAGIIWAVDRGADVINISVTLGWANVVDNAIDYAEARDVVVVAAAGNDAEATPGYPASHSDVLSVGASDEDGVLASFSNAGADIVAPGIDLVGAYPEDANEAGTAVWSGTSFAAAIAAGTAALVRADDATLSAADVRDQLVITATSDDLVQPADAVE